VGRRLVTNSIAILLRPQKILCSLLRIISHRLHGEAGCTLDEHPACPHCTACLSHACFGAANEIVPTSPQDIQRAKDATLSWQPFP
jgi:hypothetical protein